MKKTLTFILLLISLRSFSQNSVAYVRSVEPFGSFAYYGILNNLYNYTYDTYNYTEPVSSIFSPSRKFVILEGSDYTNPLDLSSFLSSNQSAVESWVSAGGKLFINAAPSEGGNINLGFGGTQLNYNPDYQFNGGTLIYSGIPATSHAIFNGPSNPGNYWYGAGFPWIYWTFANATISGTGLTGLIQSDSFPFNIVLSEKNWGSGKVIFGGLNSPDYFLPYQVSYNLFSNIFYYLYQPEIRISVDPVSSPLCAGTSLNITYSAIGTYLPGNIFTVYLVDYYGSYYTIGSVTSTTSGTISCTLPTYLSGGGFRIKVLSSYVSAFIIDNGSDILINTTEAPYYINGPDMICKGTVDTFSVPIVYSATSYNWFLPPGLAPIGPVNGSEIIVSVKNNFVNSNIFVSATNSCGMSSMVSKGLTLLTNKPAVPSQINIDFSSNTTGVCPNFYHYASVPGVPNATGYKWTASAGIYLNQTNDSYISFTLDTGFSWGTISVQAYNCIGMSATQTISFCCKAKQPGPISGDLYGVCGSEVTYTIPDIPGATSYNWIISGAGATIKTVDQGGKRAKVKFANNYSGGAILCVYSTNACGTSIPNCITIGSTIPAAAISVSGPSMVCKGQTNIQYTSTVPSGNVTYKWTATGGGTINGSSTGSTVKVNSANNPTAITLTLQVTNPCGVTTKSISIAKNPSCRVIESPTEELSQVAMDLNIYPNPSSGSINLSFISAGSEKYIVRIFDLLGKSVYDNSFNAIEGTNELNLDLSYIPKGIYLLYFENENGSMKETSRIIIQ